MLEHVLSTAPAGQPDAVLAALDSYGWGQEFLMNVGDVKGKILDDAVAAAVARGAKVFLEIGAYCERRGGVVCGGGGAGGGGAGCLLCRLCTRHGAGCGGLGDVQGWACGGGAQAGAGPSPSGDCRKEASCGEQYRTPVCPYGAGAGAGAQETWRGMAMCLCAVCMSSSYGTPV